MTCQWGSLAYERPALTDVQAGHEAGVLAISGVRRGSRLSHLGDDLVRYLLRNRLVVREFHRVRGTAAGHAAQLSDVTKHLRQRHGCHDGNVGTALDLLLNGAAPAIDVADDITQVVLRSDGLNLHD